MGPKEVPLRLWHNVCVKYGMTTKPLTSVEEYKLKCWKTFSPGLPGESITYQVSEIIEKGSIPPWPPPNPAMTQSKVSIAEACGSHRIEYLLAALFAWASFICALISGRKKFDSFRLPLEGL